MRERVNPCATIATPADAAVDRPVDVDLLGKAGDLDQRGVLAEHRRLRERAGGDQARDGRQQEPEMERNHGEDGRSALQE